MKVMIRADTELDNPEELIALIKHLFTTNNPEQKKLPNEQQEEKKKYFCNNPDCKKEITKDIVAYCLHPENKDRFKGKVFCRECQEEK